MVMRQFGGPDVLRLEDQERPTPRRGQVLVQVGSVAVSTTRDLGTRTGQHPFSALVTMPHVLGGDFAGTVVGVGQGVSVDLVGDRVAVSNTVTCDECEACHAGRRAQCVNLRMLGIHLPGSYAEFVAVPAKSISHIPDDMGFPEASALASNGPIALTQLRTAMASTGQTVLIPGATGALGSTLVCLATSMGADAIALTRRPHQLPPEFPAGHVLDARQPDLSAQLLTLTAQRGVNAVADNIATQAMFEQYYDALAIGGRVVISGAIGSPDATTLQVAARPLYLKSQSILGVRTTNEDDIQRFWRLVQQGFRLAAGLVLEYRLEDAAQAHSDMAGGEALGAVVLDASVE